MIVLYPNDVLSSKSENIVSFDSDLKKLVDDMSFAMYSSGGVGLAAPQFNVSKRVMLIDHTGGEEANKLVAMINPCVTWRSPEVMSGKEGCLSLPGMQLDVVRSLAVEVEYNDVMGNKLSLKCTEMFARIVQHEIDHLDGVMMLYRVSPMQRRLAMKDIVKNK